MLALTQYGRFAIVALAMLVRWTAAKWNSGHRDSGAWVTSRTGNVTVVTDKIF
ncbi:MAG TPA: hypothetical protein VMH48_10970 [Methylomirabilota bacterium]|nr:hypothetical protein [Methylomirabilota bacterium]